MITYTTRDGDRLDQICFGGLRESVKNDRDCFISGFELRR